MADNMLEKFKGKGVGMDHIDADLRKELMADAKRLAGGDGGYRRISIKGGRFRQMVGKEQQGVNNSGSMNIVILNSAPVARTYFAKAYDPNETSAPTCWSSNTDTPDPSVPEDQRQATRCMDCPMNVKGSGQGETRACRYSQRSAVALEGELDVVYQLQLPATSLFGDAKDGKMPMSAYVRYLVNHDIAPIGVLTKMYFDENSETPKLFFKPVRPLDKAEVATVLEARASEDTTRALELTVHQPETETGTKTKPETKKTKKKKDKKAKKAKVEDVPEPEKVSKKAKNTTGGVSADNITDVMTQWGDDDD